MYAAIVKVVGHQQLLLFATDPASPGETVALDTSSCIVERHFVPLPEQPRRETAIYSALPMVSHPRLPGKILGGGQGCYHVAYFSQNAAMTFDDTESTDLNAPEAKAVTAYLHQHGAHLVQVEGRVAVSVQGRLQHGERTVPYQLIPGDGFLAKRGKWNRMDEAGAAQLAARAAERGHARAAGGHAGCLRRRSSGHCHPVRR